MVDSPLIGRHQLRNVALAIAAAVELREQGFPSITAKSIERGIRETRWPGRFQIVPAGAGRPEIVLDVAHNPAERLGFAGGTIGGFWGASRDDGVWGLAG